MSKSAIKVLEAAKKEGDILRVLEYLKAIACEIKAKGNEHIVSPPKKISHELLGALDEFLVVSRSNSLDKARKTPEATRLMAAVEKYIEAVSKWQ